MFLCALEPSVAVCSHPRRESVRKIITRRAVSSRGVAVLSNHLPAFPNAICRVGVVRPSNCNSLVSLMIDYAWCHEALC